MASDMDVSEDFKSNKRSRDSEDSRPSKRKRMDLSAKLKGMKRHALSLLYGLVFDDDPDPTLTLEKMRKLMLKAPDVDLQDCVSVAENVINREIDTVVTALCNAGFPYKGSDFETPKEGELYGSYFEYHAVFQLDPTFMVGPNGETILKVARTLHCSTTKAITRYPRNVAYDHQTRKLYTCKVYEDRIIVDRTQYDNPCYKPFRFSDVYLALQVHFPQVLCRVIVEYTY